MPTRVVLTDTSVDRRRQQTQQPHFSLSARNILANSNNSNLKSTIWSMLSPESSEDEDDDSEFDIRAYPGRNHQIGNGEISSSPRLPLYLNIFLSSAVNLVSVIQFWLNEEIDFSLLFTRNNTIDTGDIVVNITNNATDDSIPDNGSVTFVDIEGTSVFRWKFVGAFVVTLLGTVFSLLIIFVHFDTVCFPKFWHEVFMDGSPWERNLSVLQVAFWTMGVHICTSSFSVGYTQANVFFTSWIALFSAFFVYDSWRVGAELPSFMEFMASTRKTTLYNWLWATIFAIASAGALLDIFLTRDYYIFINDEGEFVTPTESTWYLGLISSWIIALICSSVVFAKIKWKDSPDDYVIYYDDEYRQRHSCINKLRWYHLEGVLIGVMVCVAGWLVMGNTIQNFYTNPSNLYFSAWGYFFSALFTFGTWIANSQLDKKDAADGSIAIVSNHGKKEEEESENSEAI